MALYATDRTLGGRPRLDLNLLDMQYTHGSVSTNHHAEHGMSSTPVSQQTVEDFLRSVIGDKDANAQSRAHDIPGLLHAGRSEPPPVRASTSGRPVADAVAPLGSPLQVLRKDGSSTVTAEASEVFKNTLKSHLSSIVMTNLERRNPNIHNETNIDNLQRLIDKEVSSVDVHKAFRRLSNQTGDQLISRRRQAGEVQEGAEKRNAGTEAKNTTMPDMQALDASPISSSPKSKSPESLRETSRRMSEPSAGPSGSSNNPDMDVGGDQIASRPRQSVEMQGVVEKGNTLIDTNMAGSIGINVLPITSPKPKSPKSPSHPSRRLSEPSAGPSSGSKTPGPRDEVEHNERPSRQADDFRYTPPKGPASARNKQRDYRDDYPLRTPLRYHRGGSRERGYFDSTSGRRRYSNERSDDRERRPCYDSKRPRRDVDERDRERDPPRPWQSRRRSRSRSSTRTPPPPPKRVHRLPGRPHYDNPRDLDSRPPRYRHRGRSKSRSRSRTPPRSIRRHEPRSRSPAPRVPPKVEPPTPREGLSIVTQLPPPPSLPPPDSTNEDNCSVASTAAVSPIEAESLSAASTTLTVVESNPFAELLFPVPGVWAARSGLPGINTQMISIGLVPEACSLLCIPNTFSNTSPPPTYPFILRLLCMPSEAANRIFEETGDGDHAEREQRLLAVQTQWPKRGHLIINMNVDTPWHKCWMPQDLGPDDPPLDVTRFLRRDVNTIQFIQLDDLTHYAFVLVASLAVSEKHPGVDVTKISC
ncbi:hypothetical protein ONZ45_g10894 [Pleurotus djamor]|nr:hypothetical protein ONZ45_g10894 [Pleurotus djamor]